MIAAYHREHGDDYGTEQSRWLKYRTVMELMPSMDDVLDAGCGTCQFAHFLPESCEYTGIDLLDGTDVRDYDTQHAVVVANGLFYKLSSVGAATELIRHLWSLATDGLIFTSLSSWGGKRPEELILDPLWTLGFCRRLTDRIAFRHDYAPGDFCVGLYR